MSEQKHQADPRILGRRTLERDHRSLAGLLRPGMFVLDVGCGTGAITAGIARAAGPRGRVAGVDRDEKLLQLARSANAGVQNLHFVRGDATSLSFRARFDIVTAARTLQWISEPARAVMNMKHAAKPGGMLVILDYTHAKNGWEPEPPREFQQFYSAFLAWRTANGWDNEMADHLPALVRSAGLVDVSSTAQDEVAVRGAPDFTERAALWPEVIESLGEQVVKAGFASTLQLGEARERYAAWARSELLRQTLAMRAVTGIVPT